MDFSYISTSLSGDVRMKKLCGRIVATRLLTQTKLESDSEARLYDL